MTEFDNGSTPVRTTTGPSGTSGTSGTAEHRASGAQDQAKQVAGSAKDQASAVAGTAKDQASAVAGSAQEQAKNVLGEVSDQAGNLLDDLRGQLTEQSEVVRGHLSQFLTGFGRELGDMAQAGGHSGHATQLVRQVGDHASSWGSQLEDGASGDLLEQTWSFARRKPGIFLAAALAAGVAAGRLGRGAKAQHDRTAADEPTDQPGGRHVEEPFPVTPIGAVTTPDVPDRPVTPVSTDPVPALATVSALRGTHGVDGTDGTTGYRP